jgi:hypothetical protein
MKKWFAIGLLLALAVGTAGAAEKFENKTVGIALELPAGFVSVEQKPENSPLGDILGLYAAPDAAETGSGLLIHVLEIPGGDYDTFKGGLPDLLKGVFQEKFKLVKQEDTKFEKMTGFMLDFECPGDGSKPQPGGSIPHHVRWYLIREGDKKLVGLIYTGREAAWKDVSPKFDASAKTLKSAGN